MGAAVVDGDYIGRAVPEETQSTCCLFGKQGMFFTSADRRGNITSVMKAANPHSLERLAKMLVVATCGDTAVAGIPLIGREMKEIVVRDTLSTCLRIGRALRQARHENADPVAAGLEVVSGWRLFEGTVVNWKQKTAMVTCTGPQPSKAKMTTEVKKWRSGSRMKTWSPG